MRDAIGVGRVAGHFANNAVKQLGEAPGEITGVVLTAHPTLARIPGRDDLGPTAIDTKADGALKVKPDGQLSELTEQDEPAGSPGG